MNEHGQNKKYKHDKGLALETSFEDFVTAPHPIKDKGLRDPVNKTLQNTYEQHTQGLY
ncbi:hypothetical protein ACSLVK_07935 [Photorhabdus tasmaniensis]|uniref:hypothetical protein n=1 Tax=Photorhabdus tasmaniensis TaxID=1004159 RepID=UPI004043785A